MYQYASIYINRRIDFITLVYIIIYLHAFYTFQPQLIHAYIFFFSSISI